MIVKVALVQDSFVTNILMWDSESSWLPPGYVLVEILESHPEALDIGWSYQSETNTFSAPEV